MIRTIMRCIAVVSILWGVYVLVAGLPMMATYREQEAYNALRSAETLVAKNQASTTVSIDTATLRCLNHGLRIREEASYDFWGLAAITALALIGLSTLYLASGRGTKRNEKKSEPPAPG